jgi:hypothetical protein
MYKIYIARLFVFFRNLLPNAKLKPFHLYWKMLYLLLSYKKESKSTVWCHVWSGRLICPVACDTAASRPLPRSACDTLAPPPSLRLTPPKERPVFPSAINARLPSALCLPSTIARPRPLHRSAVASNATSCSRRSCSGGCRRLHERARRRPDAPPQDPQVCKSLPAVRNRAPNPNLSCVYMSAIRPRSPANRSPRRRRAAEVRARAVVLALRSPTTAQSCSYVCTYPCHSPTDVTISSCGFSQIKVCRRMGRLLHTTRVLLLHWHAVS